MKKDRVQEAFLAQLRRVPIIEVCCEKTNVSRMSINRWRKEDKKFDKAVTEALTEGDAFMNDLGESQLISLIKDKHWPAISFWLRHKHPQFRDKLDITARIEKKEELTPEQQEIVRKALKHAALLPKNDDIKTPE
jgi:hypothetical protein